MRQHVPVEFVLLRKSFFAKSALVRSVPAVNSLMILEVRTFDETSVTEGTLIRFDPCHTGIMIAFALLIAENLMAYIALVLFRVARYYHYVAAIATFRILALVCHLLIELFFCLTILGRQK